MKYIGHLDSGARIPMVPEVTLVKDADGGITERDLARVVIEIGSQVRDKLVALAKGDVNGRNGLLSIDLENDKE